MCLKNMPNLDTLGSSAKTFDADILTKMGYSTTSFLYGISVFLGLGFLVKLFQDARRHKNMPPGEYIVCFDQWLVTQCTWLIEIRAPYEANYWEPSSDANKEFPSRVSRTSKTMYVANLPSLCLVIHSMLKQRNQMARL